MARVDLSKPMEFTEFKKLYGPYFNNKEEKLKAEYDKCMKKFEKNEPAKKP